MKTSTKQILLIFILSLFIEVAISPLRGLAIGLGVLGAIYGSVLSFVIYSVFMFFVLKKFSPAVKPVAVLLASLAGCAALQLPLRIQDFMSTLGSLPDFLFHLLGIATGYLLWQRYRRKQSNSI